jgi:hypothetical protein
LGKGKTLPSITLIKTTEMEGTLAPINLEFEICDIVFEKYEKNVMNFFFV